MPSDAAATATTRGAPQHLEASDTDDARVRVPPAPAMDPRSISESLSDEVEHAPRSVSDLVSTVALDGAEVPEDRRDQAQAPLDADAFLPAGDDGPTYVSSSPFELDIERTIVDPPSFITRGARSPDVADEESMPAPTSSDGGPVSSSTPSGRRKRKKP